jgi:hypothetical protein
MAGQENVRDFARVNSLRDCFPAQRCRMMSRGCQGYSRLPRTTDVVNRQDCDTCFVAAIVTNTQLPEPTRCCEQPVPFDRDYTRRNNGGKLVEARWPSREKSRDAITG